MGKVTKNQKRIIRKMQQAIEPNRYTKEFLVNALCRMDNMEFKLAFNRIFRVIEFGGKFLIYGTALQRYYILNKSELI